LPKHVLSDNTISFNIHINIAGEIDKSYPLIFSKDLLTTESIVLDWGKKILDSSPNIPL
jgi:hypothetical protein